MWKGIRPTVSIVGKWQVTIVLSRIMRRTVCAGLMENNNTS